MRRLLVLAIAARATFLPAQGAADASAAVPPTWAFQPLGAGEPPAAADAGWDQPIDRFVLDGLRRAGLAPNPPADKRTLLRRATYALIGLPPTPDAVDAFLADAAPDALPRAVDALLASPHFGERQARFWLDLARYSDSNGLDENLAFAEAWRYRDWVVRAFDADLPFDQFGTLQLAGDLLPASGDAALQQDRIVATGFLALGPKLLAEQDKQKLVLDTVDEQVDLVGRTFLGLTLGCARCHDHKFDPVTARDYYALAGIFKSTATFENLDHVSRWREQALATQVQIAERKARAHDAELAEQALQAANDAALAAQRRRLVGQVGRYLLAGHAAARAALLRESESADRTNLQRDAAHWGAPGCVVLHTHTGGVQFAEYDLDVECAGAFGLEVRLASKEARPMRVLVDGGEVLTGVLGATTGDWFPANQRWFRAGELQLGSGRHVLRFEAIGPDVPHLDKLLLAPIPAGPVAGGTAADGTVAEGTVPPWPQNVAAAAGLAPEIVRNAAFAVRARDSALGAAFAQLAAHGDDPRALADATVAREPGWPLAAILAAPAPSTIDEFCSRWQVLFATVWQAWEDLQHEPQGQKHESPKALPSPALEGLRVLLAGPGGIFELTADELQRLLPASEREALGVLERARDAKKVAVPPPHPQAICVRDGTPVDLPVHLRGDHLTLAAEPTPRGFPSILASVVQAPAIPKEQSGRLELARWLFQPQHPLVARVAVNRVWQQLFGQGLVRSASNFGARGDRPSHLELLDWLARTFVADGWSQKRLLRRILLSAAWQQSSDLRADAVQRDPENRLLWRQQRRRLEAEAIRDAILATAGSLDRTIGGTLLETKDRDYVTNDQSNDKARYDAPRRSLYLPIIRNAMYDMFTAFDYADPSVHLEQRPSSAVATQALFLLNSPFMLAQSALFARAAQAAAPGDEARIAWIWARAFQRAPLCDEQAAAARWLAAARQGGGDPDAAPWQGLCQAVLMTNEFVYVD